MNGGYDEGMGEESDVNEEYFNKMVSESTGRKSISIADRNNYFVSIYKKYLSRLFILF